MFSESIMLVCLAHLDLSRFVCRSFDASFQQMVLWMRRSQCEAPGLEDCLLKDDHPAVAAELARLSLSSRGGSDNDGDDYDSDDDDDIMMTMMVMMMTVMMLVFQDCIMMDGTLRSRHEADSRVQSS